MSVCDGHTLRSAPLHSTPSGHHNQARLLLLRSRLVRSPPVGWSRALPLPRWNRRKAKHKSSVIVEQFAETMYERGQFNSAAATANGTAAGLSILAADILSWLRQQPAAKCRKLIKAAARWWLFPRRCHIHVRPRRSRRPLKPLSAS